jgi:hypothetical protein
MRRSLVIKTITEYQIIISKHEQNINTTSTKLVSKYRLLDFPEEIRLGGSDGEEELSG